MAIINDLNVHLCSLYVSYRAGGTGQAGQAKTGPLFLHVMFGIDRYTVMVVKDYRHAVSTVQSSLWLYPSKRVIAPR